MCESSYPPQPRPFCESFIFENLHSGIPLKSGCHYTPLSVQIGYFRIIYVMDVLDGYKVGWVLRMRIIPA